MSLGRGYAHIINVENISALTYRNNVMDFIALSSASTFRISDERGVSLAYMDLVTTPKLLR